MHLMTVTVWRWMLMTKITPAHIHARARSSVGHFFEYLYPLLHPKRPVDAVWYIHAMSEAIMSLSRGETNRLIINAPPRSSKTNLCTIFNIGFILGKDPSAEIMLLTYGEELTRVLASNVHHLMRHPAYMRLFPHTRCVGTGSQGQALRTSAGGKVHFTSIQGTMTGLGADWIILDDPLQAAHRRSDKRSDNLETTFREALSTRLNNPSTGKILLIQQRIAPSDLCGRLTEQDDHPWTVLALPAEFMAPATYPLGRFGGTHEAQIGDLLIPDHLTRDVLKAKRLEMGEAAYAAQYLQAPIYEENNPIEFDKLAFLKGEDIADELEHALIVQSWDTALTANANSDYSAVTTWARLPSQKFVLLHAKQIKLSSDKLVDAIIQHAQAWSAKHVLVEHANHARDLIRDLQKRANGRVHIKGVPHQNLSKEARLDLVLYLINAGRVRLLEEEKSLDLLLHQLRQFPNGKYDDLVDSFTQALRVLPTLGSGKAVWRIS
jgi:predicted phage terminase large subunit-like protein